MKKSKFWLMMIFFAIMFLALVVLHCLHPFPIVMDEEKLWSIHASLATILGVVVALVTYIDSTIRTKKQKTYEALFELKRDVYLIERKLGKLTGKDIKELIDYETEKESINCCCSCANCQNCTKAGCASPLFDCGEKCKKRSVTKCVSCFNKCCGEYDQEWEDITKYLTKLEHFSTCVNQGIFDLETVRRMSGSYLSKQVCKLSEVIAHKKRCNDGLDTYEELEALMDSLKWKKRKQ